MIIHSKVKDYSLEFVDNVLSSRKILEGVVGPKRCFFIVDAHLKEIYADAIGRLTAGDTVIYVKADERNKEYLKLADYFTALIDAGFTRNDVLVTIGGGVLQDLSGFIASTLYRGLKWVFIPTTLLAQADSCIGSKTSINFGPAKNLIGTFYPPDVILLDVALTKTLGSGDFNSGVGEIIKFHLLSDAKGYAVLRHYLASGDLRGPLLKEIIFSTLMIKKSYFEADEFDTGRRNLLNYGHCFGHALESVTEFGVPHGQAVIVGMSFANLLSLKRGLIGADYYQELEDLFTPFYPHLDKSRMTVDAIIAFLKKDKKRAGQGLTMILSRGIGDHIKADDLSEDEIRGVYHDFMSRYSF